MAFYVYSHDPPRPLPSTRPPIPHYSPIDHPRRYSRLKVVKEGLLTMLVIHSHRDRHDSLTNDNYALVRPLLTRPFVYVVVVQWLDQLLSILRMRRWVCGRLWSDCSFDI